MQRYVVKPIEPTVLAGKTHHVLKNTDLMLGFKVDTAHIVPGPIDLERFNDALAKTLSVYPLFAGRMQRAQHAGEPWKIRLTNDGVPVAVVDSDAEQEVPYNCVIQNPWTLSEPIKMPKYLDFDSDEPLLRVTITSYVKLGSTCIGLSGSHVAGDGYTFRQFLRLLSQLYQGLPPLDAPPSYDDAGSQSQYSEEYTDIPTPDLDRTYNLRKTPPFAQPVRTKPQRVDLRLSTEQVARIQDSVRVQAPSAEEARRISRQDALTAFMMFCMAKADPDCLPQDIRIIVMNRGLGPIHPAAMTNALIWAVSDRVADPAKETMYSIASRMRRSIERVRQPAYNAAWDAVHSDRMLEMANSELAADFTQGPHEWILNSTWRFDWTSAHFGYEGQTRFFHTLLDEPRFVKLFQPNPATFYLQQEARERFRLIFDEELHRLGVRGGCKWI